MKCLIYAIIVVLFAAYTTQETEFIFGLGKRTVNDQFLTKLSQKAGPGPVGNLTLYFNYAKDEQHFTYMNFTSPNGRVSNNLFQFRNFNLINVMIGSKGTYNMEKRTS